MLFSSNLDTGEGVKGSNPQSGSVRPRVVDKGGGDTRLGCQVNIYGKPDRRPQWVVCLESNTLPAH